MLAGAHVIERFGWALGGVTGVGFFMGTRGFVPSSWYLNLFMIGVGAIVLVIVGWVAGALSSQRAKRAAAG